MGTDLRAFIASIFACILIVFTVYILQIDPASPAGYAKGYAFGLVFHYQTLITGILAIVAAVLTVAQMRASDRKSDERHRQLMLLSTRADALRVERMLDVCVSKHQVAAQNLLDMTFPPFPNPTVTGGDFAELVSASQKMIARIHAYYGVVGHVTWKEAESLFGGVLTRELSEVSEALSRLEMHCEAIQSHAALFVHTFKSSVPEPARYERLATNYDYAANDTQTLARTLPNVLPLLFRLALEYQIDIKKFGAIGAPSQRCSD